MYRLMGIISPSDILVYQLVYNYDLIPYTDLMTVPKLIFTKFRGFHGAFAMGVAYQQEALTLLDTWFRLPFWDLLMLLFLRTVFPNSPCLFRLFDLNTPRYFLDFASAQPTLIDHSYMI